MTVSQRHENSNARIRHLIEDRLAIGKVWINNHERGANGYKLPAIFDEEQQQLKQFTIDCLARLKTGAMIAFEVDYQYKDTARAAAKMDRRDELLGRFGIVTVRATPAMVDEWEKDPSLLQQEIDYWLKRAQTLWKTSLSLLWS